MKDIELEHMEVELKELKQRIIQKQYDLIFNQTGLQSNEIFIGDFWNCPESPIGKCVYDKFEDSAHDHCVFCGEPEDRD